MTMQLLNHTRPIPNESIGQADSKNSFGLQNEGRMAAHGRWVAPQWFLNKLIASLVMRDGFIPSLLWKRRTYDLPMEAGFLTWGYIWIFVNVAHWDNFEFCRFFFIVSQLSRRNLSLRILFWKGWRNPRSRSEPRRRAKRAVVASILNMTEQRMNMTE